MPPAETTIRIDFELVVKQHYENLYRFALSLIKTEADASDLVQQTFYIFSKKQESIRDTAKIKSWLFTTLYREFLGFKKRHQRMTYTEPEILELEAPSIPSDSMRKLESNEALKALQSINEDYRIPLTLFYLEALSYKEISELLNIPMGTVMSRLARGKSQLKKILSE